jgi:hypothetical protein
MRKQNGFVAVILLGVLAAFVLIFIVANPVPIKDTDVLAAKMNVYGEKGSEGKKISRQEADHLFGMNDFSSLPPEGTRWIFDEKKYAIQGEGNDPQWRPFFIEAISAHLLQDDASPGGIDEEENKWLAGCIDADEKTDHTEKALLSHIETNANSIPDDLKFRISCLD